MLALFCVSNMNERNKRKENSAKKTISLEIIVNSSSFHHPREHKYLPHFSRKIINTHGDGKTAFKHKNLLFMCKHETFLHRHVSQ